MVRRLGLVIVPVSILAGACTAPAIQVKSSHQAQPPARLTAVADGEEQGGQVMISTPNRQFLFGQPLSEVAVQPGTLKLKAEVVTHPRLEVTALLSTPATVAIGFKETAKGDERWGEVMIPEERKVFKLFAADRALGRWLILITDVEVVGSPDPVPVVAYRWQRQDVEQLVTCGIPPSTSFNRCTDTFYAKPQVLFVDWAGRRPGQ